MSVIGEDDWEDDWDSEEVETSIGECFRCQECGCGVGEDGSTGVWNHLRPATDSHPQSPRPMPAIPKQKQEGEHARLTREGNPVAFRSHCLKPIIDDYPLLPLWEASLGVEARTRQARDWRRLEFGDRRCFDDRWGGRRRACGTRPR
jgi:hypothetical protein